MKRRANIAVRKNLNDKEILNMKTVLILHSLKKSQSNLNLQNHLIKMKI